MFFEAFRAFTGLSFSEITKVRKVTLGNLKTRATNQADLQANRQYKIAQFNALFYFASL